MNGMEPEGAGVNRQQVEQETQFIRDVSRKAAQCALDCKREITKLMGNKVKVIFGISHGEF